ncbi:type I restriction-modification system subunit M [uncultured Parasutterella sp.]|uniref:type I restriction-modification system subunit M n=1 Tax=uncultured Parasutterella sp. TaxID=1263098 RepID=UPI0025B6EDC7|nr:type I restriction-modification system subunit M [uncultured Parasutterella sp.]
MSEIRQDDLNTRLWSAADEMRTTMSADDYKDYLLGLVFYKNLSDEILYEVVDLIENRKPESLDEAQKIFEEAYASDDKEDLIEELINKFGCYLSPESTFVNLVREISERSFMLSKLAQIFRDIEQSQGHFYEGLFEDFDINSKKLGKTPAEANRLISTVILKLAEIDFHHYGYDALGDAYEYLISRFASESGKKAGEFYTPRAVSSLIAQIVTKGKEEKNAFSVYDPTMGSGSLLLQIKKYIRDTPQLNLTGKIQYFGQELKNQTYNLARMNMILHRVSSSQQHLRYGDTLGVDWPSDEPTTFDAVVMNPPYSQNYSADPGLLTDPRFAPYGKLPPKSKADFAFLLHGFYHLKDSGTMGIVLPHGVLFRGGAEEVIRKKLLENSSIYAVIGLPSGIFYSTSIPTCILVLKKNHIAGDVLFIDASKDYKKVGPRNYLLDEHLEKILAAYTERKNIDKYAHLATKEEIEQNEYNLNIPRYVDTMEKEAEIDLQEVFDELRAISTEQEKVTSTLNGFFEELGLPNRL